MFHARPPGSVLHGNTEGLTGVEGGVQKVLWHCPDNQGHICLTEGGVGQGELNTPASVSHRPTARQPGMTQ